MEEDLEAMVKAAALSAAAYASSFDLWELRQALEVGDVEETFRILRRYPPTAPVWRAFFDNLARRLEAAGGEWRLEFAQHPLPEWTQPVLCALDEALDSMTLRGTRVGVQYMVALSPFTPPPTLGSLLGVTRDPITARIAARRLLKEVEEGEVPSVVLVGMEGLLQMALRRYEGVPELAGVLEALVELATRAKEGGVRI